MSTIPSRSAMVYVSRQMRAYFAPVDRCTETPAVFDPGLYGKFPLSMSPSPWVDLGWIENFQRTYETPTQPVRAGAKGLPCTQFRGPLEGRVEFDFQQWGKLQMALAGGSEHMNVLAPVPGSTTPVASGGTPAPAAAVLAGSTASQLVLGTGVVGGFPVGTLLAVDVDYQQQVGYVGTGISAAYVSSAIAVKQDPNYVRRVTFNVGRVAQVTAASVLLAQPLLGGVPPAGASAQAVVAFVDREGGSFFQEWSALFVAEEESGGRVCFYYPRLSPNPGVSSGKFMREQVTEIAKPCSTIGLHASFLALPYVDENDGQTVLCYRSYFPAPLAAIY